MAQYKALLKLICIQTLNENLRAFWVNLKLIPKHLLATLILAGLTNILVSLKLHLGGVSVS